MLKKEKSIFVSKRLSLILSGTSLIMSSGSKKYSYPLVDPLFFDGKEKRLFLKEKKINQIKNNSKYGLSCSKISEGILGSQLGYSCSVQIVGIGFSVSKKDEKLIFKLGYSHLINIEVPKYLSVSVENPRKIKVEGVNYSSLHNFVSMLQELRSPSIYKKKGLYLNYKVEPKIKQGKRS